MHKHILAALACLGATSAFGQSAPTSKLYVGLDVGRSQIERSSYAYAEERAAGERNSESFELRIGYQLTRHFALEVGYIDLGDFTANDITTDCAALFNQPCPPVYSRNTSMRGPLVNAKGRFLIGEHLYFSATGGLVVRETTIRVTPVTGPARSNSASSVAMQIAVGVGVPINPRFEVGVDWSRHIGDKGTPYEITPASKEMEQGDTDVVSLGLRYRF